MKKAGTSGKKGNEGKEGKEFPPSGKHNCLKTK